MKNWPAYKNFYRACRNTTEVIRYLKELGLDDFVDNWYLKNEIRDKGIEFDYDNWLNSEETEGASIQIEYASEYDPRQSVNVLVRFEAYDREANSEKVVEPAHYQVRITKYTKDGLEAKFAE